MMGDVLTEKQIEIDFTKAKAAYILDDGRPFPQDWKRVDFVVDDDRRILIIELKDPSNTMPRASQVERDKQRKLFAEKMLQKDPNKDRLLEDEIVPKAIRSYLYLHMMNEDTKPYLLVLFIGMDNLTLDPVLLGPLQVQLRASLKRENDKITWKRDYVQDCIIVNEKSWATYFPKYPLTRKP